MMMMMETRGQLIIFRGTRKKKVDEEKRLEMKQEEKNSRVIWKKILT